MQQNVTMHTILQRDPTIKKIQPHEVVIESTTTCSIYFQLAISTIKGVRVGRKQTERFACKYHTSWASLEPQSSGNQLLFSGSKLLINSSYRIRVLPEFAVCLPPTAAPYRGNCQLCLKRVPEMRPECDKMIIIW